ncbi:MAG TPA: O-antigen ligase family protein [Anaerolineales bacterium]|nr:O-antigen ligase family protein [Anaerolineales bacterium]
MPRFARLAIFFSFILHGGLILTARYRLSYDAYIHMFFADHYRMDWWSLWDARWYTGFYVSSYPPLVHQLIGLLSPLIGLEAAFALVLWTTVTLLPLAVYAFARVFIGRSAAGYASLGAAFLPSVYLTAHIFGQLPMLAGTTTALFGCAALAGYVRSGDRSTGALAVACMATTMAFHHATLLFLPWAALAVVLHLLLTRQVGWKDLSLRLLLIGSLSIVVILLVIWPFWEWGTTQTLQTPIDHASRHNFFRDPLAALLFFLPMYGPLIIFIPFVFWSTRKRRFTALSVSFGVLFLLGLGDTTPLPRGFFRAGWEWLTYDRFALWASLLLLPFLGMLVLARRRTSKHYPRKIFSALAVASIIVGLVTTLLPLQPGAVDMDQVVDYLEQDGRSRWRYLTFGFGDQLARLSTLTPATTIDGSYHTARTLPELRSSGVGQIDTAYWLKDGLSRLDPILQKAGDRGVRWGFVNVPHYIPVLERNGWIKLTTLPGRVQVWENPGAVLPDPPRPPDTDPLASFSWGTLPFLSLLTTLALGSLQLWPVQADRVLRGIHAILAGLVPVSLCFWYYRSLWESPHERVYFTYSDALFFVSDALALLAVLVWLTMSLQGGRALSGGAAFFCSAVEASPRRSNLLDNARNALLVLLLSLFLLSSLSILWSSDWRTSLYISLHFWLVFLLVLSLRDQPAAWKPVMYGLCTALSIQIVAGLLGFSAQSTALLEPLNMKWPGALDPSVPGAVVVQLPEGTRVLRAYGTLPHPNLLGGFAFISLLGPIALFMRKEQPNDQASLLLIPGISVLALSFSRSAWLALILFCLVLIWKSKYFDRRRLAVLLSVSALSFILTLLPYYRLVEARTVNITANSERFAFIGRAWLNGEALQMLWEHPLTGVGLGSFIIELSRRAGEGYVIEPAHNIFLLAGAELGIIGTLLVVGLFISLALNIAKAETPHLILVSAALAGLGVISLFDHYLWTLAPGRMMLGLVLGLWAGKLVGRPGR